MGGISEEGGESVNAGGRGLSFQEVLRSRWEPEPTNVVGRRDARQREARRDAAASETTLWNFIFIPR